MITDKITIKYENTTFKMSKYIFNSHYPLMTVKFIKENNLDKMNTDITHRRKIIEKLTKKEIRTYFKEHHIKSNYREYAEYFIIEKLRKDKRNLLQALEDRNN